MRRLNTVHVDQFHGETYLRIETTEGSRAHVVAILDDRQKLGIAKKLLRAIKLPTKGPARKRLD